MLTLIFFLCIILIIYFIKKYNKLTKEVYEIARELNIDPTTGKPLNNKTEYNEPFLVAGTYYYTDNIKKILNKKRHVGDCFVYAIKEDYVLLKPEPQNEYDPNAIAVYMNGEKIGHVPAYLTRNIKPLLGKYNFVGLIKRGDKWHGDNIIHDSFVCEVRIEDAH